MPMAKVSDIEMYYEEVGQGDPLMIVTGWARAERAFSRHVEWFSQHYRCIRHDKRGIGQSGAPDAPYSTKMMADDLDGLMEHLNLASVRVLGGGGMGALIAMELAINYPDRVRSLVLGSPCVKADNFLCQLMLFWKELRRLDVDLWAREVTFWCYAPESFNARPEMPEAAWKARGAEETFPQPWAFDRIIDAYLSHDVTDRVHLIRCPTLITTGGSEDFITGPRYAREVYARIPGAKLHLFEGTSHNFHIERFEEFGQMVLDWFAQT